MNKTTAKLADRVGIQLLPYQPLERAEELRVVREAQQGSRSALHRLCQSFSPMVLWMARRYAKFTPHEIPDLFQQGMCAVIEHAVPTFDCGRGARFVTYAQFWIRSSFEHAADSRRAVSGGKGHIRLFSRLYNQVAARHLALTGELDQGAVFREIGITPERAAAFLGAMEPVLSMSPHGVGDEEHFGLTPFERYGVESDQDTELDRARRNADMAEAVRSLDIRYRTIVERVVMGDECDVDLAREWGLSRERIRQLRGKALAQLRSKMRQWAEVA